MATENAGSEREEGRRRGGSEHMEGERGMRREKKEKVDFQCDMTWHNFIGELDKLDLLHWT